MGWCDEWKVDVPEGAHGAARIERFTVSTAEADFTGLRALVSGGRDGYVPPGTYTSLRVNGHLWMSDTPQEVREHSGFIRRASGRALVTGLGLGMVAAAVLRKPQVEHVTVVEIDPDVVALVGPHLVARYGDRVRVVEADAYTWRPPKGERFTCAWHDVWANKCADNLPEMARMVRHFAPYVEAGGQSCWGRNELRAHVRRCGW